MSNRERLKGGLGKGWANHLPSAGWLHFFPLAVIIMGTPFLPGCAAVKSEAKRS